MIREWCDACGRRMTMQPWRSADVVSRARCPERCGFDDGPTIDDVAGAFWSAVAHERARHDDALTLCLQLARSVESWLMEDDRSLQRAPQDVAEIPATAEDIIKRVLEGGR